MGGGGESVSRTEPPEYVKPYNLEFLNRGTELSNQTYQPYTGQRVASSNPYQNTAAQGAANLAVNGNSALNATNDYIQNSIYDNYLNMAGQMTSQANPYQGMNTTAGTNQYLGMDNPYLNQTISNVQQDMSQNYNMTANPMFERMNRQSGAYGNSGIQQMRNKSLADLNTQMGKASTDIRMNEYGNQQQLAEADINRKLSNDQQNIARNAGMATDQQNRQLNAYQTERNNQMQAMGMAPQLASADMAMGQNLWDMGDKMREIQQQELNANYDTWTQAQEQDLKNLEILGKTISGSMGGGQTFTTTPENKAATLAGLGLGGIGLAGLLGG